MARVAVVVVVVGLLAAAAGWLMSGPEPVLGENIAAGLLFLVGVVLVSLGVLWLIGTVLARRRAAR